MRARFYLPGLGRFASADTLVPDLANPQSLNRYSYVLANPLKYRDPSGHAYDAGNEFAGSYEVDNERLRSFVEKGAIPKSVAILSEYYYPRYKDNPDQCRGTSAELYAAVYSEYALGRNLKHPDALGLRFEISIPTRFFRVLSGDSLIGGLTSVDVNIDYVFHQDTEDSGTYVTIGTQVGPSSGSTPNISVGALQIWGINALDEYKGFSSALGGNAGSIEIDFSQALDMASSEPWHTPSVLYLGVSSPAPYPSGYSVPVARTWSWADFKPLLRFW